MLRRAWSRLLVAGMTTWTRLSDNTHLSNASDQDRTPSRSISDGSGGWSQSPFREGSHDDDTKAEFFCEREDSLFDNPFPRVVWDLDRVDATRDHDHFEFIECVLIEMGRSYQPDPTPISFPLEELEVRSPRNEVVHLLQVDPTTEQLELASELAMSLGLGWCPYLGGDDALGPVIGQRS